ncbi:phage tail tape measure protein [Cellulosimicrobium funkei]|nr:phage tail tape measure protein [Cellulosimicrobium funkei]
MADEVVRSRFEAETSGYERAVGSAAKATDKLAESADKAGRSAKTMGENAGKGAEQATTRMGRLSTAVTKHGGDMEKAGSLFLGVGTALTAVSVGAGKAAMDWESAWGGVMKTNDGTSQQTQKLEQDLRNLTSVLPATHTEIAGVAEAAGQLGVGIDSVAEFSETMLNLGETTNLSADEAATALARFSNVMGTSFDDADRLGSTIVGLGNNFATTESEIVNMGQRIAPVGRIMNMTEADVLAMATAMSSVGIEAEAGGTAIGTVMKKIDAAVREDGESLVGWAEAAGVSADEFAAAWQDSPAQAMEMLTSGLGDVNAAGGDVNGMLADLGVKGIRETSTLLSLATASDVLSDALDEGATAWEQNIALTEEAELRYETTESRIRIAWNGIKDAAIDAGAGILPVVAMVAESAAGIAKAFADLPDPVKGVVGAMTGVAGLAALAAGGFLKLAPQVAETATAMQRLNKAAPTTSKFVRGLGKAGAIGAGVAILGAALIEVANASQPAAVGLEEVVNQLLRYQETGDIQSLNELFDVSGVGAGAQEINSLAEALDHLDPSDPAQHIASFGASVLGIRNIPGQAAESIEKLDQAMASMDSEQAADQMNNLRQEMEAAGRTDLSSWSSLQELFPEYTAGIEAAANATGEATSEADLFQAAMGNLPSHMQETTEAAEDLTPATETAALSLDGMGGSAEEADGDLSALIDSMRTLGLLSHDVRGASRDWEASLDDLTASIKDNGTSLDESTAKGRANWDALEGVAEGAWSLAEASAAAGESQGVLEDNLKGGYDALYANLEAMTGNEQAAEALAREIMGIPPTVDIDTWMSDRAMTLAQATGAAIEAIPGYKPVTVAVSEEGTAGSVQASINEINGKTEYVFVEDDGTTTVVQAQIQNINGVERTVYVDDNGTIYGTQEDIYAVTGKQVTIRAEADTSAAEAAINLAARARSAVINVTRRVMGQAAVADGGIAGLGYFPKHAKGRLPGHAMGRLPYTGRGTDRILGVNAEGWPVARVDDGEGIIRESSTRKHLGLLSMVNDDDPRVSAVGKMLGLPGYAGGNVGREWSGSSVNVGIDYDRLASAMGGGGNVDARQYTFPALQGPQVGDLIGALSHQDRKNSRA